MSFEATEELVRKLKDVRRFCNEIKCDEKSETVMIEAVGDMVSATASILIAAKQGRYGRIPTLKEFNEENP